MHRVTTRALGAALLVFTCNACTCGELDFSDFLSSSSNNKNTSTTCDSNNLVTGIVLTADSVATGVAPSGTSTVTLSLASSDTTAHTLQLLLPGGDVTATLGATSMVPGRKVTLQVSASPQAVPSANRIQVGVVASLRNAADALTISVEVVRPFTLGVTGVFTDTSGARMAGTATIVRVPGLTGPVTVSLPTLPGGWSAQVPNAPTTGSSVPFTIVVPDTAPPAFYFAQLRATYGATTLQQQLTMRVIQGLLPPDITIGVQPGALSVDQGTGGSFLVSISRTAPGIGPVSLTVAGLPTGAAGTFAPPTANDTSRLSVTTAASTPPGSYPLTITGVAGTITRQGTATLVVTAAPTLSLAVTPATLTIAQGATGQASVTITRTNGAGAPTLDVQGLPAGVSAAFFPSTAGGAPTSLVLTVGSTVAAGSYPLTVRGIAGSLTATAPFTLVVTAPTSNLIVQLPASITIRTGETALVPVRLIRTGAMVGVRVQAGLATVPLGGNAWVGPTVTRGDTTTLQVIGGTLGTWPVSITAAAGGLIRTAAMSVTVTASTVPDFTLVPQAKELQVPRGQFVPAVLLIDRYNGFSTPTVLSSITDSPGNYVVDFTPATATNQASVSVNIYASPNITPGPHLIIYRGTANGVERRGLLTIHVQ